jgi:hypothetical protein
MFSAVLNSSAASVITENPSSNGGIRVFLSQSARNDLFACLPADNMGLLLSASRLTCWNSILEKKKTNKKQDFKKIMQAWQSRLLDCTFMPGVCSCFCHQNDMFNVRIWKGVYAIKQHF